MDQPRGEYGKLEEAGARTRREHGAFLTRAVRQPRDFPRIPRRGVDQGGFDPLLRRANGATLAARWWTLALQRVGFWTDG